MNELTQILNQVTQGKAQMGRDVLPVVYDELRRLASARLAQEPSGQTLQATALVHEAYLRLVDHPKGDQAWDGRAHFFAAAAEAMRRILVERARKRNAIKHGGDWDRVELQDQDLVIHKDPAQILALDEAMEQLAASDEMAAKIVSLKIFAGLSMDEAADILGLSRATAYRQWTFARAWLKQAMEGD